MSETTEYCGCCGGDASGAPKGEHGACCNEQHDVKTAAFPVGSAVAYGRELGAGHVPGFNCAEVTHHGTVTAVEPDASGDQVVTVEFDCGLTQDILASELRPA